MVEETEEEGRWCVGKGRKCIKVVSLFLHA